MMQKSTRHSNQYGSSYRISGVEEERIRLVSRDPDNLLVSWISSTGCI